jgi:hypothetical protein
MENTTYLIKNVNVVAEDPQTINVKKPNIKIEPVSWEKLHEIVEMYFNEIKKVYGIFGFKKIVVTIEYVDVNEPNHIRAIDFGFDKEGDVYCS